MSQRNLCFGSALTRLDERLRGRDVRVVLPDELPLLHVDPVLLEQLLVNLLENAVKHTPAGTAVEVRGRVDDGHVSLAVRDFGPGLAAGDTERVFDKFYRGWGVASPGAGLGLAICRAIAEVHGGTLRADNHSAGGAVFTLSLPVTAPPPAVEPAPA